MTKATLRKTRQTKVHTKNTPKPKRKPMTPEHKAALAEGRARRLAQVKLEKEKAEREEALRLEQEAMLKATDDTEIQSTYDESRVIFKPNPGPQTYFLAAPEQEVLYGGAAGGGKSYGLLADALRGVGYSSYVALILRRTNDELRELIQKSKELYPQMDRGAKWSEKKSEWVFSSGARIWMTYLDKDDDVHRYQGQSFSYIAFDELTHWPTPYAWDYLRSRLRNTDVNITPYMRATSNPGGVGHCLPFGEVLTESGWKDIEEVTSGTKVLSVDCNNNVVVKEVSDTVKEYYKGILISREDQMVFTENHRLPILNGDKLSIRHFYDLPGQTNVVRAASSISGVKRLIFTVPEFTTRKTKLNQPSSISYSDYAELMGWFLSEGHTVDRDKEFGISQTKSAHRMTIKNLLDRCEFSYRESNSGFHISSPSWWNYLKNFGKCRDKYIPRDLMDSSDLHILFHAMMSGDGHWRSDVSGIYYTISRRLADDFSELCVRLGYSVRVSSRQRENRTGLSYEVSFNMKRKTTELNTGNHIYDVSTVNSKINCDAHYFSGYVYCLTVPDTETFFVRQNGYVWLSGNTWVKQMFVDPAEPNMPFWARETDNPDKIMRETEFLPNGVKNPNYGKPLFQRRFIPAKLTDNPYLMATNYMQSLMSLPEEKRRALLEGDWGVSEGAAFPEFRRARHVVAPFDLEYGFRVFRSCDYGYGSHTSVLYLAVAPNDQIFVVDEIYVSKVTAQDLVPLIKEKDRKWNVDYGILDSSCWAKRGDVGPSIAETLNSAGLRFRPSDRAKGSRIAGKNKLHMLLAVNDFIKEPMLLFFSTVKHCIQHLESIPLDDKNFEDVDTEYVHDHSYDALRYGVMSRPRSKSLMDFGGRTPNRPSRKPPKTRFGGGY